MKPIQYILFFLFSGKRVLLLGMGMLWMTGCAEQQEEGYETPERIPVQFTASAGGVALPAISSTRTTNNGDQWSSGDEVGIFMKYAGKPLGEDQIAEGAENIKYIASVYGDGTTAYLEAGSSSEIYYPASKSVDFIAYYPYGDVTVESNMYIKEIIVKDQLTTSDQADVDLLYSDNQKNISKDQGNRVELEFGHVMSRLIINVIAGQGMQDAQSLEYLRTMNVRIYGMPTTARFSLSEGRIYEEGNTNQEVQMRRWETPSPGTNVSTYDVILLPQSGIYRGREVRFQFSANRVLKWPLDNDIVFEQGKVHTWDITVNNIWGGRSVQSEGYPVSAAGMELEVGRCTLTDWNPSGVDR